MKKSLQKMLKQKVTLAFFIMMRINGDDEDDRYRKYCLRELNKDIAGLQSEIVRFQLKIDSNEMALLSQRLREMLEQRETLELFREMRINGDHQDDRVRERCLRQLNEEIMGLQLEIVRYRLKIDNNEMDIPFTLLLQLTIFKIGPDGWKIQYIERMRYTENLGSAVKYLIGRLLNKRMNYVKELRIASFTDSDCFWLPTEMKLTARHLIIEKYYEEVMRTVGRIFRRINDRPFQIIGHKVVSDDQNTRALVIKEIDASVQIHTIRYSLLHFDFIPNYAMFISLIDHWVIHGAPIGTWYTAFTTPMQGLDWYDDMKRREGHIVVEKLTRWCPTCPREFVILPLPNNAQLEFYIVPIRNQPFPSVLNFEINPIGN